MSQKSRCFYSVEHQGASCDNDVDRENGKPTVNQLSECLSNTNLGTKDVYHMCPSTGLKDGKTLPSAFMSMEDYEFEKRIKLAFKKQLPKLQKTCFVRNFIYNKNLNFGFVNLKGEDLQFFFRNLIQSQSDRNWLTNSYLRLKFGRKALVSSNGFGDFEYKMYDYVSRASKDFKGHKNLNLNKPPYDHYFRCKLKLVDLIQNNDYSRIDKNFYINSLAILNDLPSEWNNYLSVDWLEKKKFKKIRRVVDLKKALIMTGELFCPYRCLNLSPNQKLSSSINVRTIFEQATDQIYAPSQSCEGVYFDLITDWKKIEHLDIEDIFRVKDQIGFDVNVGLKNETQNFLSNISDRFMGGLTHIVESTQTLLTNSFENFTSAIKGLSVFIVGSILVGLAVKYSCKMITKLFNFVMALVFGIQSKEYSCCRDQAGDSETFLGPLILLTSVFGVSSAVLKVKQISDALRILSYLPRAESGVETILEWVKDTYTSTHRLYMRHVCGVEVPLTSNNHPVDEWLSRFQDLHEMWNKGTFTFDLVTYQLVHSLWIDGSKLLRSLLFKADHSMLRHSLQCLEKILQEFRNKRIVAGTMRNPPVTILLYGDTSVGKSTCTMGLAASILSKIMPEIDVRKHWGNLVYSRAAEQEYWDGYTGQPICVFDDYSQSVDTSSAPNLEHFEIIRSANSFPYPLHMADLADKGSTNFESKVIICSSNLAVPKTESLNFPDALYRRFDLCLKVSRASKYEGIEPKSFVDDFYNFQQYSIDAKTRRPTYGGTLSWDGIVEIAKDIYRKRSGFVASVDKFIEKKCKQLSYEDVIRYEEKGEIFSNDEERKHALENIVKTKQFPIKVLDQTNREEWVNQISTLPIRAWKRGIIEFDTVVIPQSESLFSCLKRRWNLWRGGKPTLADVFDCMEGIILKATSQPYRKQVMSSLYQRCPFLSHASTIAKFLLVFVSAPLIFYGCKKILSGKKNYKEVVVESYGEKNIKQSKTEAYGEPNVKSAKVESYGETQQKVSKTESIDCSVSSLPEYSQFVANDVAAQLTSRIRESCDQAAIDQNAAEICTKLLTRNLYKIFANDIPLGHALMLKGRVGLMPAHFIYVIERKMEDEEVEIIFKSVFKERAFTVRAKDLLMNCRRYQTPTVPGLESRDLCSFSLTKFSAFSHPDISKIFCESVDLQYLKGSYCCLPTLSCPPGSSAFAKIRCTTTGQQIMTSDIVTETPGYNNRRSIRQCWTYRLDSSEGDCGAPLILRNPQLQPGKLVGIHVAGREGGFGYSTPVYRKDIESILSSWPSVDKIVDQVCSASVPKGHIMDKPSFRLMDTLKVTLPNPTKTVIQPSPIYGLLQEPKTKPCLLREKDGYDPILFRLEKFGAEGITVSQQIIDNSCDAVFHHIYSQVLKQGQISEKAIYTYEEAIAGIDGEEYLSSLKRKSSPGFPFVVKKGYNKKEDYFGPGPDWNFEGKKNRELKARCEMIISDALEGKRGIHPFIDTLKDERKPIDKAHKTRLFSACPLDYLVCCKMYMMGLVSVVTKVRNFTGIAIGTNVYSHDWDHLARLLLNKSENLIAGDFAGFDSTQTYQLLRAACRVIALLFQKIFDATEQDVLVLNVLLESLCASIHICKGNIYQSLKNLPSGHFLTAFINSIFVFILFCCAWQLTFGENLPTAFSFFDECGIIAYGDDHVVSVPRKFLLKFNQITLIELMKKLNMEYTLEDKDAVASFESRSISEISFLKRQFIFDERVNRFVAPLSLDTILESPMWIKKCVDPVEQTIVELENSLRELSIHPSDVWDEHISKFKICFQKLHRTTVYFHRSVAFENVQKVWERSVFDQANSSVKNDQIVATQMTGVCIYNYLPGSPVAVPHYPGKQNSIKKIKWSSDLNNSLATQNSQNEKDLTTMSNPTSTLASEVNESAQIRQEITAFADDKAVVNQELPLTTNLPKNLRRDFQDERQHTVIDFLKRPRLVQTVAWLAQTQNQELISIDIPTGILSTMQRNKLDGFTSFRATAIVRIQVNAQPFQAGRLLGQIIPVPQLLGNDRVFECRRSMDRRVVMNSVQLDISKQSEVTLRIPYVSPFAAFDLIAGKYEYARFILSVYSPLNQVSQAPLQVNLWAYFEDVEMGYPTMSPLYTPSVEATDQVKLNTVADVAKAVEGHGFITQAVGVLDQVVQSGADVISGFVPSLKPVVNPIAKLADAGFDIWSGAANALSFIPGLSKPEPSFHGKTILQRPTQNFGTGDGVDHGLKLAMHNMNRLDFLKDWAGSEMDELSFDYLKRMPNFIDQFNYSSSTTYGTILWSAAISPTYRSTTAVVAVGRQGDSGVVILPTPTHLQYICGPFQQWRGSLIYTFKFVKTDYHSGRVEICFLPFAGGNTPQDNADRFDYVYKVVVDLREQTEVSMKVDFTSVTPYKFINHAVNPLDTSLTWENQRAWSTGRIIVRAITPLQLGSNIVSNTIECLVEVKAGQDFEVTVPIKQSFLPVRNFLTNLSTQVSATDQVFATAGSKDLRTEYIEGKIDAESITGLSSNSPKISADKALACVGESFGNFRTFLKRFAWFQQKRNANYYVGYNDLNPPTLSTGVVTVGQTELPWLTTANSASADQGMDPLCYIANMYAFYRGGVRYKVARRNAKSSNDFSHLFKATLIGTYPEVQPQPQFLSANAYEVFNKGMYEYTMPFNNPAPLAPVNYVEDNNPKSEDTIASPTLMFIGFGDTAHDYVIARAGADDFDLGYFLGPPPAINLDDIPERTQGSDINDFGVTSNERGFRLDWLAYDPVGNYVGEVNALNA